MSLQFIVFDFSRGKIYFNIDNKRKNKIAQELMSMLWKHEREVREEKKNKKPFTVIADYHISITTRDKHSRNDTQTYLRAHTTYEHWLKCPCHVVDPTNGFFLSFCCLFYSRHETLYEKATRGRRGRSRIFIIIATLLCMYSFVIKPLQVTKLNFFFLPSQVFPSNYFIAHSVVLKKWSLFLCLILAVIKKSLLWSQFEFVLKFLHFLYTSQEIFFCLKSSRSIIKIFAYFSNLFMVY